METTQNITKNIKRRRNANKKRLIIFGTIFILVAFLLGWTIMKKIVNSNTIFSSNIKLDFYKDDLYASNSKLIVYTKANQIHAINAKGRNQFTINDANNIKDLQLSEKYMLYFSDNKYTVCDIKGKKLTEYQCDENIFDMRLYDEYVLLIKKNNEGKSKLIVNDFKNKELYSKDVNSATIVDFGFIPSSQTLWCLDVDNRIPTPLTVFTSYNIKKNSASSVINIADQMIDKFYINSNKLYVIGTSNLIVYNLNGTKDSTDMVYGWKLADSKFNANKPVFVFVPRDSDKFNSIRIKHGDRSEYTLTLQEECIEVIIGEESIYSFSEQVVYYTDYKGENIKKANVPFKIKGVKSVFDGKCIIADDGNSFSLLSLS